METLYIWLLVFGGASLLLLGMFLFASDGKFGKPHRQIDAGRRQHPFYAARHSEIGSPAGLIPINKTLLEKTPSRTSRQHEEGESMVEKLQTGQPQLAGARCDNDELQGKIANLIKQLHANERRLSESTREIHRIGQRNSKLETEVAHLKQQLKASQARQQQLLNQLQTTKSIGNNELLAQIDSISNQLAGSQETADELQTAPNGTKSEHQQFQADSPKLQAEITTLRNQLSTIEQRFSEPDSRARHDAECRAPLQTELPEPTRRPAKGEATAKGISRSVGQERALRDESEKQVNPLGEQIDDLQKKQAPLDRAFKRARKLAVPGERNRPVGIISTTAAIAIVGAAIGFLRTGSDNGAANVPRGPRPSAVESPVTIIPEPFTAPGIAEGIEETAPKITEVVEQTPPTSSVPILRGTFKTTRPTGFFAGPSEESALIRTLARGTKIDVINSRDGWLEVRSMRGTSGFVQQEAAVKTSEDQS